MLKDKINELFKNWGIKLSAVETVEAPVEVPAAQAETTEIVDPVDNNKEVIVEEAHKQATELLQAEDEVKQLVSKFELMQKQFELAIEENKKMRNEIEDIKKKTPAAESINNIVQPVQVEKPMTLQDKRMNILNKI